MDGPFYHDTKTPFLDADAAAVSPLSTYVALVAAGLLPPLGANYFAFPGKALRIRGFGRFTTGATPGNLTFGILYGTGASANGVTVCETGAVALVASQSNMSFEFDVTVVCRSKGATGTLFGTGKLIANPALIASTAQPLMLPASSPAVSAAVDLTSPTLVLSPQMKRSGSTAEAATLHDLRFDALN